MAPTLRRDELPRREARRGPMASSWVTIKEAEARRLTAETQTKLLAKRIKDLEDEMMMSTEARQAAMTRLREEEEARVAAEVRAGLRANKLGGGLGQRGRGAGGRVRAGGARGGKAASLPAGDRTERGSQKRSAS